jgi:hypothetical protein
MQVILEVISGGTSEQRKILRKNQSLEVGRSAWVDFSFETDRKMSSRHFRVVTTRNTCFIEDLDSSNGTEVNGKPIIRQVLSDDDKIVAGETRFVVRVHGASSDPSDVNEPMVVENTTVSTTTVAGFSVQKTEAGSWIYRGAVPSEPGPMLMSLSRVFQSVLIVEPKAIDQEVREKIPLEQFLFSYMEESARRLAAPICFTDNAHLKRCALLNELFGKNEAVVVLADKDHPDPIGRIADTAGAFLRPKACLPQLTETTADMVATLLKDLVGVFVECDEGESWAIVSVNELSASFKSIGWYPVEDESLTISDG